MKNPSDRETEATVEVPSLSGARRAAPPPSLQSLMDQLRSAPRAAVSTLLRADQRKRWLRGERLLTETYLGQLPVIQDDHETAIDLIFGEIGLREEHGEDPKEEEYLRRFPHFETPLKRQFMLNRALDGNSLLGDGPGLTLEVPPPAEPGDLTTTDMPQPGALRADGSGGKPAVLQPVRGKSTDHHVELPETIANLNMPSTKIGVRGPATGAKAGPPNVKVPGYDILSELGRGGMGVVYKAQQLGLKRLVALKMILAGSHASPQDMARLHAEAEAVARLQHPNIVQIHEVGKLDDLPYLSLEYVEGGCLVDKINGTPMPNLRATCIVERLAQAMHYAHQRGIVHRDLKPGNILLAPVKLLSTSSLGSNPGLGAVDLELGTPKITDFGLAKSMEGDARITHSGAIVGTPSYMAPEQAAGQAQHIGPRTDVYSLGAILYELLTGRPPFRAATAVDTILLVLSEEPVPPSRLNPNVPRDLENICLMCLQKDPARRYQTALALAEDLCAFREGRPVTARPIGLWERSVKLARRHPGVAASVSVVLLISVVAFTLVTWQWHSARQARDQAEQALVETELARQEEEKQRLEKEGALQQAQLHLYFNRIALAEREWAANDVLGVLRLLDNAPEKLRHWEWDYLKRLCQGGLFSLDGKDCVAISPDGNWLASAAGSTVKVWDLATRKEVFADKPKGEHGSRVNQVAFSGDSKLVASASDDETIKIWQVPQGTCTLTLQRSKVPDAPPMPMKVLALHPEGKWLACAGDGDAIYLWDLMRPKQEPLSFAGHTEKITCLAFTPDGKQLVSGSADKSLKLWGLDGQTLRSFGGHLAEVNGLALSRDGQLLASASSDKTVRLWDPASGQELRVLRGHASTVHGVAFSPGNQLASCSGDSLKPGEIKLWEPATGEELNTFRWATQTVTGVVFSPDGKRLISADNQAVMIWDAANALESRSLRLPRKKRIDNEPEDDGAIVMAVAFDPRGKTVASAGYDNRATLWDVATEQVLHFCDGHGDSINALCYSPDGKHFATASDDRTVRVWNSDTGLEVFTLSGHSTQVLSVVYSPDGKLIASAGYTPLKGGEVRLWDARTGKELRVLSTALVSTLAFSADGKRLAGGATNPFRLIVWDVATGQASITLDSFFPISATAFSPDGRWLVAAGGSIKEGIIKLWDVNAGKEHPSIRTRTGRVGSVTFSPDGRRILAATWDRTLRLFDPETGVEVLTMRGHTDSVNGVAFSSDGCRVASASSDKTVRLWDATPAKGPSPAAKPASR
jgi:WD40 repeat protein/serine/threonine protein kinase